MERLDLILDRLKAFALTRPVAYGAPSFAVAGLLAGLFMQMGPQDGPYVPEMERVERPVMAEAEPIAWPTGKVPDYVIGTDSLKPVRPPAIQYASYEPVPEPDIASPDITSYVPADRAPSPPPAPDETRWASARGDILDVSLPEDAPRAPVPTVLAGINP